MKEMISTKSAPAAIGPYSQGIKTKNLIFLSGQLPINPVTGDMPEKIEDQTKQSLENIKAILKSEGLDLSDVIKATVFLSDMENFKLMNDVYKEFFAEPYPARSAVEVARLPKDALIEIEVIAAS
ncbi:MAG: RidA family protein [Vulcanibacillus sp.]